MLLKVVNGYDKRKYHAIICCIKEGGAVADELEQSGYDVLVLNKMKGGGFELGTIKTLRNIIKDRKIHVLRTHQYHANLYGRIAGILAGVPVMVPSFHNLYRSPERPKFHRRVLNYILGVLSDALVAVSHTIASDIIKYDRVNSHKISVIYNGVAVDNFIIDVSKTEARRKLDLPENMTIIGSIGRLTEQKGHSELIEAALRIENVCIAIAGDGPLKDDLRKRAESLNVHCILTGELSPGYVPIFLRALDVFCFPSLWEGLPSALVEAMAAGLPVVASDIPPHREVMGDSGLFATPADPDSLLKELNRVVNDESLRNQYSEKARERAKKFSIENTVEAYERLFDTLLQKKRLV